MKKCPNCSQDVGDDVAICRNCGASISIPQGLETRPSWMSGDAPGCLAVLLAVLDFIFVPFALQGLWGVGVFQIRPPLWGEIAFYAFQLIVFAAIVLIYAAALRRGAGARARPALLAATVLAALILGVGTACDAGMIARF